MLKWFPKNAVHGLEYMFPMSWIASYKYPRSSMMDGVPTWSIDPNAL